MTGLTVVAMAVAVWVSILVVVVACCKAAQAGDRAMPRSKREALAGTTTAAQPGQGGRDPAIKPSRRKVVA